MLIQQDSQFRKSYEARGSSLPHFAFKRSRNFGIGTLVLVALCAALPIHADDDGFARNNVIHFEGHGSGASTRDGSTERLSAVNVDIDRGGKILVSFRVQKGHGPLMFSGSVIDSNPSMLKADVASGDAARLRGSMYLSRNAKGEISHIALEATNGQEHLHLDWNRR